MHYILVKVDYLLVFIYLAFMLLVAVLRNVFKNAVELRRANDRVVVEVVFVRERPVRRQRQVVRARLRRAPIQLDENGQREQCFICIEPVKNPVYYSCGQHVGCRACVSELVRVNGRATCPVRCNL